MIKGFFAKPNVKQSLPLAESKRNYVDPITGGADMVITFEKYDDTKWFTGQLASSKIWGSWFDKSIYFFKKDLEIVKDILQNKGMEYKITNTRYMSVEEAIDRTISAVQKRAVTAKGNVA